MNAKKIFVDDKIQEPQYFKNTMKDSLDYTSQQTKSRSIK